MKTVLWSATFAAAFTLPLSLTLAAGCGDPLVDDSYRGDPLVTLTGSVQNPLTLQPAAEAAVYLLWQPQTSTVGEPVGFTTERVDVEPTFPAEFQIDIFAPPPESTLFETYGGGLASTAGLVMANDEQLELILNGNSTPEALGVIGFSYANVLYIPTDEDAALIAAELPGAVRGFNQLVFNVACEQEALEWSDCVNAGCEDEAACEEQCGAIPTCQFRYIAPIDTAITIVLQGPEA